MYVKFGKMQFASGNDKADIDKELGATGTVIFNGILQETGEYLTEFKPTEKQRLVIEKMRRNDGQVKAGLLALTLPLHSAHWDVEAASGSPLDQEVAAAVRRNLFEGMTITWNDFLRHALLMLPFGFSVFEKVWELRDGMYCWRKFAPRLPKTIYRWFVDDEGGLAGIQQWVWKQSMFIHINIPVGKLLVFTHEREGSNFEGTSVLRAAYKHWYYKNTLYAIDGIAAERHGIGIAHFQYPPAASEEQRKKIEDIGQRLHAHERAYVATPDNIKFTLEGVQGQLYDIKASIEHHDVQILRSILAQFISLGSRSAGSYALSQDQSDFFLMALRSVAKNICDVVNNYAIKQMVDYNWTVEAYPKLAVSDLDYINISTLADSINKLVVAGALTVDDGIETEMRRLMHLPPKAGERAKVDELPPTPEQSEQPKPGEKPEKRPKPDVTQWPGGVQVAPTTPQSAGMMYQVMRAKELGRELIGVEKFVSFKDMVDKLDGVQNRFVDAASKVQAKQIKKMVQMAAEDVDKGEVERVASIDVPFRDEMAKAFEFVLVELYDYGKEQVRKEAKAQGRRDKVKAQEGTLTYMTLLKTRAAAMASVLAGKTKAALSWEMLAQIQAGQLNRTGLTQAMTDLSDREIRAMASFSSSEALNMGRQNQAEELGGIIDVMSSAIMDENTCDYCGGMDGKHWTMGEEPAGEPPYDECEGRDKCRCVWIFTFGEEE